MSSKKTTAVHPGTNPQTLKIGSRVRCTVYPLLLSEKRRHKRHRE
jgi:hypothetical protein